MQQQYLASYLKPQQLAVLGYLTANDPIGGVTDSIPVHPDDRHPDFEESKRKNRRNPKPDAPSEDSANKHPDPNHQIDEYA